MNERRFLVGIFALLLLASPALGQQKPEEDKGLENAVQNPVADLISVPFQDNINPNINPGSRIQNVLNIQPVIPVSVGQNWKMIMRIITPIVYQPALDQTNSVGAFGLGDMNPTFFFSPAKPGKLIWGAGPSVVLPTATNRVLGQGKTSLGPSVVGLVQPGPWTIGALVNNVWSIAGPQGRPDVNQMLLQYFVTYQLGQGWYMTSSPILTSNWNASNGNKWLVPIGGGLGRVFKLGFQPVNISLQAYGNAVRPDNPPSATWQLRFQVNLLYPKLSKEQEEMMMRKKLEEMEKEKQKQKQ